MKLNKVVYILTAAMILMAAGAAAVSAKSHPVTASGLTGSLSVAGSGAQNGYAAGYSATSVQAGAAKPNAYIYTSTSTSGQTSVDGNGYAVAGGLSVGGAEVSAS